MGWSIDIKESEGKETKYKIWSNNVDSYITKKWSSEEEMINFLFWHRFREFMDKFLEDAMTFPNNWSIKDEMKIHRIDDGRTEEFYDFKMKAIKNEEIFYDKFIFELNKRGIKIDVSDGTYSVSASGKEDENKT